VPLYEFDCPACGHGFEELVAVGARAACPSCGREDAHRRYSTVARPLRIGLRGAEARRSNAVRRDREAVRREKFVTERRARREQSS
jgi:putative FmdB family regulatory protein